MNNEQLKNKADQVKQHLKKHQTIYVSGITGIVCVAGTRIFTRPTVVAPVFNNHNIGNVVNNTINNGGHCTKLVKRVSDGAMWETVTEAAKAAGCSVPKMSRHLNGHSPHVYEEAYKIVGLGTTG